MGPLKEIEWAYGALSRLLAEICRNHDYHLLHHKVYSDHLRLLLSLKPDRSVSAVVNKLKSHSSREFCLEIGQEAPLWATGYLARSIGRVRISAVRDYLARQAEHHGYSVRASPPVFRYRSDKPSVLRAAHAMFDLNYHVVFATRYRRSVFGSTLGGEMVDYWLKVAEKRGFALDQASVLPDHAHLLLRLAPKTSIEECALSLMNNSEHWMVKQHKGALIQAGIDTLWQPSAYAGSCGKVTTAMVKAFLAST